MPVLFRTEQSLNLMLAQPALQCLHVSHHLPGAQAQPLQGLCLSTPTRKKASIFLYHFDHCQKNASHCIMSELSKEIIAKCNVKFWFLNLTYCTWASLPVGGAEEWIQSRPDWGFTDRIHWPFLQSTSGLMCSNTACIHTQHCKLVSTFYRQTIIWQLCKTFVVSTSIWSGLASLISTILTWCMLYYVNLNIHRYNQIRCQDVAHFRGCCLVGHQNDMLICQNSGNS